MNNKSKKKKNKIPLCPSKNKSNKNNNNKINPLIGHWRQPSTPSLKSSKKFILNNHINEIKNSSKNNQNKSNYCFNENPFHLFIPRTKSYSENNLKKQKIILIKKVNSPEKVLFNFKNIKEYNYKKESKDKDSSIKNNLNNKNIIKDKEKDEISLNNSHYLNNTKTNTNSNTTIGISQICSDRIIKDENNTLFQDSKISKNPLEFTFGDINFFKNQITYEKKANLNKNSYFYITSISQMTLNDNCQSIDKNRNINDNNFDMKNIIKNMKLIKPKIKLNSISIKDSNIEELNNNFNYIKSFSIEKDNQIKEKKYIYKNNTIHNYPKINKMINIKTNINKIHKTPKNPKKFLNLIPIDKKYNLNKKHKLIIKNNSEYIDNKKNINRKIPISTKNKNTNKNARRLIINQNSNSNQNIKRKNKSSPKLFLKHPTLKNLFDS